MSIQTVITLLGGLAFFLFGMRVMGEGLEQAAGPKLKHFLTLMTRNRVIAMLTGICVTAIIQSSGATTVMVVGFVNAQLLTLAQAVGVIMGANIGTTVTSLLLSIKFDPGPVFAFAGILMIMVFGKKETVKQAGMVCMGLGVLFIGMDLMSESTEPLREWPVFLNLMQSVRNPLLGLLVGAAVTALMQSSSVSVGIVQVLAAGGLVSMEGALYLVLGAKIGSCTPSLLSMANSRVAAKRTAMTHLLFNVICALLFLAASAFFPLARWAQELVPGNPKLCISFMHISTSVISTVLLLPFSNGLVKLACLIIPGKEEERPALKLQYYDERLLKTPALAAEQLYREVCRMGRETRDHLALALETLRTLDFSREQEIRDHEDLADFLEEGITEGLIAVMPLELSERESKRIAELFHVVTDLERISDHAMNLLWLAKERQEKNAKISEKADDELVDLFGHTMKVLDSALEGLEEWDIPDSIMALIKQEEQNVDDMTENLRRKHIDRLKEHKCTPKAGVIFLEAINNLERVSDHAVNIASCAREDAMHIRV
ncbi:MAG: Na/Pi cotransporter family protein [Clostridia bacterium]|nr:Na/Pi cotransporter family protein [Clostridia bacterium]